MIALVPGGCARALAKVFKKWQRDERMTMPNVTSVQGNKFTHVSTLLPDNFHICEPGKPCQKGAVENMDKLIRQFIPKGIRLSQLTQARLTKIAEGLNDRVRKRLHSHFSNRPTQRRFEREPTKIAENGRG